MLKKAPGKWLLAGVLVAALGGAVGGALYFAAGPEPEAALISEEKQLPAKSIKPKEVRKPQAVVAIGKADPFFRDRQEIRKSPNAAMKVPAQGSALPQIPNVEFAEVPAGTMPLPEFAPMKEKRQLSIQGVLQGGEGKSMAILSDGRVVQVGDSYENSRIAVIGGDGIALANGEKIAYETQK